MTRYIIQVTLDSETEEDVLLSEMQDFATPEEKIRDIRIVSKTEAPEEEEDGENAG